MTWRAMSARPYRGARTGSLVEGGAGDTKENQGDDENNVENRNTPKYIYLVRDGRDAAGVSLKCISQLNLQLVRP